MSTDPAVIEVEKVSKRFTIRKDKSIKERLVNATLSKQHREDFWALRERTTCAMRPSHSSALGAACRSCASAAWRCAEPSPVRTSH